MLLKLNKFASRSFNDLSAYPIFPWVINDYKSDVLAFEESKSRNKIYRDFGTVTTAFNDSQTIGIKDKYNNRVKLMKE